MAFNKILKNIILDQNYYLLCHQKAEKKSYEQTVLDLNIEILC